MLDKDNWLEQEIILDQTVRTVLPGIKKLILSARAEGREEMKAELIEKLFEIETEKWKDAEHCTCLGYALVMLSGGEDSEGGKKMEDRLNLLK